MKLLEGVRFGVWDGHSPVPHPKNGSAFSFREVLIIVINIDLGKQKY